MEEIKFCLRCGRKLKSEASRERGYGKTCWEKSQNHSKPLFSISVDNKKAI